MALSIVSNQAASIATRSLGQSNDAATATAEKLSSGKRINSAKDDAAGSAIAARLSAEVAGLQQAGVNAGQASSLLQIADGAFQNVEDILTRAKSLSVQAGSEQISDQERAFLDQEFTALKNEIDRIANDTEFNGTNLVNGSVNGVIGNDTGGTALTGLKTADGGTAAANLNTAAATVAGLQGIQVMGVNLATQTGLNMADSSAAMNFSTAASNLVTLDGQGAGLNIAAVASSAQQFMVTVAAMTTAGGSVTGAMFTGTLTAGQDGVSFTSAAGSAVLTMDFSLKLTAMASTNVSGTIAVNLGTAFVGATTMADVTGATEANIYLSGQENKNFNFKVGTGTNAQEDEISVDIGGITTTALGLNGVGIDTKANADTASDAVSNAIDALQAKRSDVGAAQNRLDFAGQNVELTRENQEAARSELEDLNVAKAITEFSQQQLLVQAGTSTLSQANQLPQNLLQLFR